MALQHYVGLGRSMLMFEPKECQNQQALAKEYKYINSNQIQYSKEYNINWNHAHVPAI